MPVCKLFTAEKSEMRPRSLSVGISSGYCSWVFVYAALPSGRIMKNMKNGMFRDEVFYCIGIGVDEEIIIMGNRV